MSYPETILVAQPVLLVPGLLVLGAFITLWIGNRQRHYLMWGIGSGLLTLSAMWLPSSGQHLEGVMNNALAAALTAFAGALAMLFGTIDYTGRRLGRALGVTITLGVLAVISVLVPVNQTFVVVLFDLALFGVFISIAWLLAGGAGGERIAALLFGVRAVNGNLLVQAIEGYEIIDRVAINQLLGLGGGVALLCASFLRTIGELDSSRRLLGLMNDLALTISQGHHGIDTLTDAMDLLRQRAGAAATLLYRFESIHERGTLRASSGGSAELIAALREVDDGRDQLKEELLHSVRARVLRVPRDEAVLGATTTRALERNGIRTVVFIPVLHAGGPLGVVALLFAEALPLSRAERAAFESVGKSLGLALSNGEQLERVRSQATHDLLTGLPNRVSLAEVLDKRRENDGAWFGAALHLIDIDRFKEINDTLGHAKGDELLQGIAQRLACVLPERDRFVAHLGGDGFAVLCFGRDAPARAATDADVLLAQLREPIEIEGLVLGIEATVGIALAPLHGSDLQTLLRAAEVAMYHAKNFGASVTTYGPELDPHTRERLALMSGLRQAFPQGELRLHYQPKIELASGEVIGAEALIRWQHPELGLLAPGRFMPMAEVSPIINQLSTWVADQAIAWLAERGRRERPLSVAINVSVRNLLNESWHLDLIERVRQSGVDPRLLELEITEGMLMHDPGAVRLKLERLAEAGMRLSIDDFGTGYCSLAYLQKLPIHALKIDRGFVAGAHADQQKLRIVETVVKLAKGLGLEVIAEGVEELGDHAQLRALGCDYGQGFLYARAMSSADFDIWLAGWRHQRLRAGLGGEVYTLHGTGEA